ncbi:MAG: hypothetical protein K9I94_13775 [Bacteroidales bacterium]|nr:hypothetical protein [Bacteroidales bacterium]
MVGESGEIINTGRSLIRIHGGRQEIYNEETGEWQKAENAELKITEGCLRAYDEDMSKFKSITDYLESVDQEEKPGKVIILDNLRKTEVVSHENGTSIDFEIKFSVPDNEKAYWQGFIDKMFNKKENKE